MKASTGSYHRMHARKRSRETVRRGILNRPVRAMVVGIPNVGKSTFINSSLQDVPVQKPVISQE